MKNTDQKSFMKIGILNHGFGDNLCFKLGIETMFWEHGHVPAILEVHDATNDWKMAREEHP